MTQDRAKRFKKALNVLIRDTKVEEAHVFNFKEETKKLTCSTSKSPYGIFYLVFSANFLLICYSFVIDLLLIVPNLLLICF